MIKTYVSPSTVYVLYCEYCFANKYNTLTRRDYYFG